MFSEINTSIFPLRESFDAWRRYLSREFHLDAAHTKVIGKSFFRAQYQLIKLGGLLLERMAVSPHAFSYTGSTHSETVSKKRVLIMLPIRGTAMRTLGKQTLHLTPGNIYIIDRSRPGTVRFTRRFESVGVYVPREKFERIFPLAEDFFGMECLRDAPNVEALAKVIQRMHARAGKLTEESTAEADKLNAAFWQALESMLYALSKPEEDAAMPFVKNAGSTEVVVDAAAALSLAAGRPASWRRSSPIIPIRCIAYCRWQ